MPVPARFEGFDFPFDWLDEEMWFPADNPAHILGLENVRAVMARLKPDEKRVISTDGNRGPREKWHVNLPGLSRMIMASRKPIAKPFQRWVLHELIPNAFRERKERAILLENFISPIPLPSKERQFTNKLFQEFCRVYGWRIPLDNETEHCTAMRGLIDWFIYGAFPTAVREELDRLNPLINGRRKYRIWQMLTMEKIGEVLKVRIEQLLTVMAKVPNGAKQQFRDDMEQHDHHRKIRVTLKAKTYVMDSGYTDLPLFRKGKR